MNQFIDENLAGGKLPCAPLMVEIEPTDACNLRCKMCHVTYRPDEARHSLSPDLLKQIEGFRGAYVALGSGFEPTVYPHFITLLNKISEMECGVEIITNGMLMKGDISKALADSAIKIVNISFDGARRETYEAIRERASYDDVIANIAETKNRLIGRETFFAVNFTAMHSNMHELAEAVDLWDEYGIDQLRILGLVVRERRQELLQESMLPVLPTFYANLQEAATRVVEDSKKIALSSPHFFGMTSLKGIEKHLHGNVVSSNNPLTRIVPRNRQRFQTTIDNDGGVRCSSPFTFARILFNGDVQLCYQFSVGNLHTESFEQIWNGKKAHAVRDMVKNDDSHCRKCDYFKYCLKSDRIDYDRIENHFSAPLIDVIELLPNNNVAFKDGVLFHDSPRLVDVVKDLNIVAFKGEYWIVPQTLGPMDLNLNDVRGMEGVVVVPSYRQARTLAKSMAAEGKNNKSSLSP
ncbi:MAG: radical SAM protein [Nitrospira sp.]|nr:radical SAM protein [Nitrospira sp.]